PTGVAPRCDKPGQRTHFFAHSNIQNEPDSAQIHGSGEIPVASGICGFTIQPPSKDGAHNKVDGALIGSRAISDFASQNKSTSTFMELKPSSRQEPHRGATWLQ
ncbi:MAG: hypothetical protein ACREJC_14495, partial [Tepidisphaeraceae bacterium]